MMNKFDKGQTVQHLETKGVYEILVVGTHVKTKQVYYVYQNINPEKPEVWIRDKDMFEDGRFILLS